EILHPPYLRSEKELEEKGREVGKVSQLVATATGQWIPPPVRAESCATTDRGSPGRPGVPTVPLAPVAGHHRRCPLLQCHHDYCGHGPPRGETGCLDSRGVQPLLDYALLSSGTRWIGPGIFATWCDGLDPDPAGRSLEQEPGQYRVERGRNESLA